MGKSCVRCLRFPSLRSLGRVKHIRDSFCRSPPLTPFCTFLLSYFITKANKFLALFTHLLRHREWRKSTRNFHVRSSSQVQRKHLALTVKLSLYSWERVFVDTWNFLRRLVFFAEATLLSPHTKARRGEPQHQKASPKEKLQFIIEQAC